MAQVGLPRYLMPCPDCGEPLEVTKQTSTVMPGEVVIDCTIGPCEGWCAVLRNAEGIDEP